VYLQVERFKGFGVVFDTFKNTETLAYHRDVAIVVNDGEKTVELMLEKKEVRVRRRDATLFPAADSALNLAFICCRFS
jgi:hypothetical protein